MRKCFINESTQAPSDVIILGPHWRNDPWIDVEEHQQPAKWQKLVLLVVPGAFSGNTQINAELGKWLKDRVSKRRNTVRFLIQDGSKDIFADQEMLFAARCVISVLMKPGAQRLNTELSDLNLTNLLWKR